MYKLEKILSIGQKRILLYYCLKCLKNHKYMVLRKNFYYSDNDINEKDKELYDGAFLEQLFFDKDLLKGPWFDTIEEAVGDFNEGFE